MNFEEFLKADANLRRLWLLWKAAEKAPLTEAIEIAKQAEAFINDLETQTTQTEPPSLPKPTFLEPVAQPPKESLPPIPPEDREAIIQRLVNGDRNTDIAKDFGIDARRIQGIRMGAAKRIKALIAAGTSEPVTKVVDIPAEELAEELTEELTAEPAETDRGGLGEEGDSDLRGLNGTISLESAIRFLRQQEDTIIREPDGFLINGRFRLSETELIQRAERISARKRSEIRRGAAA